MCFFLASLKIEEMPHLSDTDLEPPAVTPVEDGSNIYWLCEGPNEQKDDNDDKSLTKKPTTATTTMKAMKKPETKFRVRFMTKVGPMKNNAKAKNKAKAKEKNNAKEKTKKT